MVLSRVRKPPRVWIPNGEMLMCMLILYVTEKFDSNNYAALHFSLSLHLQFNQCWSLSLYLFLVLFFSLCLSVLFLALLLSPGYTVSVVFRFFSLSCSISFFFFFFCYFTISLCLSPLLLFLSFCLICTLYFSLSLLLPTESDSKLSPFHTRWSSLHFLFVQTDAHDKHSNNTQVLSPYIFPIGSSVNSCFPVRMSVINRGEWKLTCASRQPHLFAAHEALQSSITHSQRKALSTLLCS